MSSQYHPWEPPSAYKRYDGRGGGSGAPLGRHRRRALALHAIEGGDGPGQGGCRSVEGLVLDSEVPFPTGKKRGPLDGPCVDARPPPRGLTPDIITDAFPS